MAIKKLSIINQPEIGKLIRELRIEMELTQEQFAALLGVVYPTVNRWENGRSQPSPLALQQIQRMLQELGERGNELLQQYAAEN
ncbi:helix-turn-helix domain-containing protein [Funiculus sociatus GB2-A5]|uniref:Helix-turn-helix domain-containing protein n=1 Tax=Funiculus sociatus GB2-A5 TaxID=2933946 RepID=A0ABV0JUI1_9CYAN|nr:helix-turn-helix transcriptional regulator [Trichocoleus sp. FACHB-6]MBD2060761.1 helix-turn-helix transcriptional regulator [Trichocoleus sp. FACHB-6]